MGLHHGWGDRNWLSPTAFFKLEFAKLLKLVGGVRRRTQKWSRAADQLDCVASRQCGDDEAPPIFSVLQRQSVNQTL